MSYYSPSIEKLIESFEKLPSIGNKTAARLAFHILNSSENETNEFLYRYKFFAFQGFLQALPKPCVR